MWGLKCQSPHREGGDLSPAKLSSLKSGARQSCPAPESQICSLKSGECLWRQGAPKTDGRATLSLNVGRCLVKPQGTQHLSTAGEKFQPLPLVAASYICSNANADFTLSLIDFVKVHYKQSWKDLKRNPFLLQPLIQVTSEAHSESHWAALVPVEYSSAWRKHKLSA